MNAANISLALQLLILLTTKAQEIANLLKTAQAEGRDITTEELDALASKDDMAKAELDAAIAKARSTEG